MSFRKRRKKRNVEIFPDEILIDDSNRFDFDRDQFEGRLERPLSKKTGSFLLLFFAIICLLFSFKVYELQVKEGSWYVERGEKNRLRKDLVFADRGIIFDRNKVPLSWNEKKEGTPFTLRVYKTGAGLSHVLGYVKYPKQDSKGIFYSLETEGQSGVEKFFEDILRGQNGEKLSEVNVKGEIESDNILNKPIPGKDVYLSLDINFQQALYDAISFAVSESDYSGGAGVIMDSNTGEVLASVSFPDYDSNVMTLGDNKELISKYLTSPRNYLLDRVSQGLYAPGSTMKPFIALGVLNENIIDPAKKIVSTGSLVLPNPYNPDKPTIFKDWKAHGPTNLEEAIAVSSDVYFYIVGGGFENQKGLGITKLSEYISGFYFGKPTEGFFSGPAGVVPNPAWKKKIFDEDWTLGNTYHTSIGQYGFQVTPLQLARATTAIVNKGEIVEPSILKNNTIYKKKIQKSIEVKNFGPVEEGMRLAVVLGTARALNIKELEVAAKTGTAEIGSAKKYVNSWVSGFFPYKNPKYTFALVLEKGPVNYKVSAMQAMGQALRTIVATSPEALGIQTSPSELPSSDIIENFEVSDNSEH